MYSVIGYDKDNSVFVPYGTFEILAEATSHAIELNKLREKDELTRTCSDGTKELIDWIEVYWNYEKSDEQLVWASYDI